MATTIKTYVTLERDGSFDVPDGDGVAGDASVGAVAGEPCGYANGCGRLHTCDCHPARARSDR